MLQSREHGTFLIRWSSGKQQYALSIKCGNEVGHCLIFRFVEMFYSAFICFLLAVLMGLDLQNHTTFTLLCWI